MYVGKYTSAFVPWESVSWHESPTALRQGPTLPPWRRGSEPRFEGYIYILPEKRGSAKTHVLSFLFKGAVRFFVGI